jgi:hypothetical protein
MKLLTWMAFFSLVASPAGFADPVKIELPVEKSVFKPGRQKDLVMANCVLCHSWDYVTIQPALPRATWKAIVTKMRGTFGAPLAESQIDEIVDYLAHAYGDETPETLREDRHTSVEGTGNKGSGK